MAISNVVKNFRDGTILLQDGTGTPLDVTIQYENGDFNLSGLTGVGGTTAYDHTVYLDRGELNIGGIRKTNRTFPTFSFTAQFTDLSDATNETLPDFILKTGSFASAVSTLGANADVYAVDITWTIEGTNFGDATDHVVSLSDCVITGLSIAEGDPNTFSIDGVVYGTIALT